MLRRGSHRLLKPAHLIPRYRYYTEENRSDVDYDYHTYKHHREVRKWYARHEVLTAEKLVNTLAETESLNHHNGLSRDGDGPFERELVRKGISVDKYPLPTTVGVHRVNEMVLLRRQELQRKADVAMNRQRTAMKCERPSAWYDETLGPLNLHFLKLAQHSYSQNIVRLPRNPIRHGQLGVADAAAENDDDGSVEGGQSGRPDPART